MRILFFRIIQIHDHFPIGLIHHVLIPLTGTFRHILPPLQSAYLHLLTDLFSPLNNLPLKLPTALLRMSFQLAKLTMHLFSLFIEPTALPAMTKGILMLLAVVLLNHILYKLVYEVDLSLIWLRSLNL